MGTCRIGRDWFAERDRMSVSFREGGRRACGGAAEVERDATPDPERMSAKEVGNLGELLACAFLEARGAEVLEQGYTCREGEADIVAASDEDPDGVVLVEVKTRRGDPQDGPSWPEEAVGPEKQRRYRRIASCYLMDHPYVTSIRFDVLAVVLGQAGRAHIEHIEGAFWWDVD